MLRDLLLELLLMTPVSASAAFLYLLNMPKVMLVHWP